MQKTPRNQDYGPKEALHGSSSRQLTLKRIWQIGYETVELIKKLERKMVLCNLRTLPACGIPNIKNIQGKVCLRG